MDSDQVRYWKQKLERNEIPTGLEDAAIYTQAATFFGWSPKQVDETSYLLLFKMLLIGDAINKSISGSVNSMGGA